MIDDKGGPMFSVIIPVHNKLPHLDRSINSVLRQSYPNFELIIIDDASTDGSTEKLETYDDKRIIRLVRTTPGPGGYAARNLGIEHARFDWITFLDADDEWHPNTLQRVSEVIQAYERIEVVAFNWEMRNEKGSIPNISRRKESHFVFSLTEYLENPRFMLTGTFAINKDVIGKAGGFPECNRCKRGGDIDTWIRWIRASQMNFFINEVLFYYYRNTVNRVTAEPNTYFCAYDTLMEIYNEEQNGRLRGAVRRFVNRFIYNMLARQVAEGQNISYKDISKMYLSAGGVLRIAKLHYMRVIKMLGLSGF